MLVGVGIDHRNAPVEWRERLRFTPAATREWLSLARMHGVEEGVLLSTCNRTEAYLICDEETWPVIETWLMSDWGRRAGMRPEALRPDVQVRERGDAARHLFRVAAGLESILVGEGEILAQVKEAYALARATQSVGTRTNVLFQAALKAGRQARRESDLGRYALSPGAAVVAMAKEHLGSLAGKTVWVWGSGMIARPVIEHLREAGVDVVVTSRTEANARRVAGDGPIVPWPERERALIEADGLVCAVAGDRPWLEAAAVAQAMAGRPGRPLFVVDFGVPRNAEPEVGAIDGVVVRGVDDMQDVVAQNRALRESVAEDAGAIVDRAVDQYLRSHQERRAAPLIRSLYSKAESVRQTELDRTLRRMPDLTDAEREAVDHLTQRIVRRLLNDPALALRSGATGAEAAILLKAAASLFGLDRAEDAQEG